MNLTRGERSEMAQFRCSVLPLRVETGRFVGEQVNDRICKLCNQSCVEDETHFLLNCQCHKNLREYETVIILNNVDFSYKSDDDKLSLLLNDFVRRTAKFLLRAFLYRRSILYS